MNIRKITTSIILALFIFSLAAMPSEARTKSYNTGDAINFKGKLYIGSTNMGGLELFTLDNNKIVKKSTVTSFRAQYSKFEDFREVMFSEEKGRLYAYLSDGPYLYKYDVTDPSYPQLVNQLMDNSKDWFRGIAKVDNKIVTIGSKNIKVWNAGMQVVATYNITNKNPRNISFDKKLNYVFSVENDTVYVYDTRANQIKSTFKIDAKEQHNRQMANDEKDSALYVVGDRYIKKYEFDGDVLKSFKHTSNMGYDVVKSGGYLYFTDGYGIVKLDAKTFRASRWTYASKVGAPRAWAMGLEVAGDKNGEKLVIFNNSAISVTDANLNKISYYLAIKENTSPVDKQPALSVDKNRAAPGSDVSLTGKGFGLNEDLEIWFGTTKYAAKSNGEGLFTTILKVPSSFPKNTDIKVTGKTSKVTWSIAFNIE